MNQFRGMIHKPHRHLARHAFSAKPGNLRNAQTVKAQMLQAKHLKEMSPLARGLKGHFESDVSAICLHPLESRAQGVRHRNREGLFFPALGGWKCDRSVPKSTQFMGITVSRRRQPVCRAIRKLSRIHGSLPASLPRSCGSPRRSFPASFWAWTS